MTDQDKTQTHVPLTQGTMVSHYRIVDKIGAGGMGEVYLADDTQLERKVALKFLPSRLVNDSELRARFVREAKALAKQSHPNVIGVYEVAEHDGRPYFVMEYVKGEMLKHYVDNDRQPLETVLDWGIQLCQGLGEIHRHGITHRDIKATNVIVDPNGRIRILDFGLAAMAESEGLTKAGSTLGTVAYMSPEQVSGREADQRSDLFSLGVLLYELYSGRIPFKRNNDGATLQAIMQDEPTPLSQVDSRIPQNVSDIVAKLLEKDKELRYQSAEGVLADFKRLLYDSRSTSSSSVKKTRDDNSVVVLPFENLSSDQDNEYFSDGLTDEIITDLSGLGDLKVISRSSSMKLKGTDLDSRMIGEKLGVKYILTGSVRKVGDNVRITAQLVDATNDNQIWADKYKGTLEDIFEIQEEVSQAIVSTLKLKLTSKEKKTLGVHSIENPQAFECYLRAKKEMQKWSVPGLDKAKEYLEQGLKLVGDNAMLLATLAHTYYQYLNLGQAQEEMVPKIKEFLDRALEMNPEQSEALLVKALMAQTFSDIPDESVKWFKKILEIQPNNVEVKTWLALDYAMAGRTDLSRQLLAEVRAIDPLAVREQTTRSFVSLMEGKNEELEALAWDIYHNDPTTNHSAIRLTHVLTYVGKTDEAAKLIDQFVGESYFERLLLGLYFGRIGEKEKSLAYVNDAVITTSRRDCQYSVYFSWVYSANGEYDQALDWLENAMNRSFMNWEFLEKFDLISAPMRELPRFKDLIARMKVKHSQFVL